MMSTNVCSKINLEEQANYFLKNSINSSSLFKKLSSKKILLLFGGPNICKPTHLVHLRSCIIGESLRRLLMFAGHQVIADAHLGDSIRHLGRIIYALEEELGVGIERLQETIEERQLSSDMIGKIFLDWLKKGGRKKRKKEVAEVIKKTQAGDPIYQELFQFLIQLDMKNLQGQFDDLQVTFDVINGESIYDPKIPELIKHCIDNKLTHIEDGTLIISIQENQEDTYIAPVMLVSKEGTFSWAANDLAAMMERQKKYNMDEVVCVWEQKLSHHMRQVTKAARKLQYKVNQTFIGFGSIFDGEGKVYRDKQGHRLSVNEFINQLELCARENLSGIIYFSSQQKNCYRNIAISVFKLLDLKSNVKSNYNFDINLFLSKEARECFQLIMCLSSLVQLLVDYKPCGKIIITHPSEESLLEVIFKFETSVMLSIEELSPHHLRNYVFSVMEQFMEFHCQADVLDIKTGVLKPSKIPICYLTLKYIEKSLYLLGISIKEFLGEYNGI